MEQNTAKEKLLNHPPPSDQILCDLRTCFEKFIRHLQVLHTIALVRILYTVILLLIWLTNIQLEQLCIMLYIIIGLGWLAVPSTIRTNARSIINTFKGGHRLRILFAGLLFGLVANAALWHTVYHRNKEKNSQRFPDSQSWLESSMAILFVIEGIFLLVGIPFLIQATLAARKHCKIQKTLGNFSIYVPKAEQLSRPIICEGRP